MYQDSVYPVSQRGSSGIAFEAGVKGQNLTEWQFGLASKNPRWNVSGTYMQALPRFLSTDQEGGDEKEFLREYFDTDEEMLSAIFLKGYQWPFDVKKIFGGSSLIDLIVYQESILKHRRIFLDYRNNSNFQEINFNKLSQEAYEYLSRAGACFGRPIERLSHMNQPAVEFYREHGVDLEREMLEVAVCVQHNNGGLAVDKNWETNMKGLFAVGEVCGSHGVTRPGGSALNAGQVGGTKAAETIARKRRGCGEKAESEKDGLREMVRIFVEHVLSTHGRKKAEIVRDQAAARMSRCGGMIRNEADIERALKETVEELKGFDELEPVEAAGELEMYFRLRDMLLSQQMYLYAMRDYLKRRCGSRGSALYTDMAGEKPHVKLPDIFRCSFDDGKLRGVVQEVALHGGSFHAEWRKVRPVPADDYTFETEWKRFREEYLSAQ